MKLIAIALLAIMALGVSPSAYAASPYFDGNVSIPEAAAAGIITAACGGAGLTPGTGKVSPFYIDATGALCTNANSGAITVNQGTSPWIVDTTGSGVLDGELTAPIAAQIAAGVLIGSTQISDGACSSSPCATNATVLAASTAAAPTNKALVVSPINQDPCNYAAKTSYPLSSNATSLTQLIAASGSTKIYVCSIAVITASATAFNLNTGTGTNCGSSTAALIGSTTAANGMSLAANGGFTLGNGGYSVAVTAASSEICILQSNASYSSGVITYVQQ